MTMIDCKCFECPLPDCVDPCPFRNGKEKKPYDEKREKKKAYNREYYLKNKERLKDYKKRPGIKNKEQYLKDMFGDTI